MFYKLKISQKKISKKRSFSSKITIIHWQSSKCGQWSIEFSFWYMLIQMEFDIFNQNVSCHRSISAEVGALPVGKQTM